MIKNNEIIKAILVTGMISVAFAFTALAETSQNQADAIQAETIVRIVSPEEENRIEIADVGVRKASKYINLHKEPNNEAEILAVIPRGDDVVVVGRENGFIKVSYKDLTGYIGDHLLMTDSEYQNFMDSIPYHEEIPLDKELQKYFYLECLDLGVDYAFMLSIVDRETGGSFNPNIISKTSDYGLCQINGPSWTKFFQKLGYIKERNDLLNPYTNIHCALYLMKDYVAKYGVSEASAFWYNRGHASANSSNAYSRDVINNRYPKWKAILEQ